MPLRIGDRFSSYEDLQDAMHKYEQEMLTKYPKRDSRTIGASRLKMMKRSMNEKLIYYEIKFTCMHGGKQFQTHSTGKRQSSTCKKDCPAFVRFKISEDGESLELTAMNEQHLNHDQEEINSLDVILKNGTGQLGPSRRPRKIPKRRLVTKEEKMFAIEKLRKGVPYKIVAKEYGVDENTAKDWKKFKVAMKENYRKCIQSGEVMLRKKKRMDHNEILGDFVYHWYMQQMDENISVTDSQIQEKARAINTATEGKPSFIASPGWLYKWKTRYGIQISKRAGKQSKSIKEETAERFNVKGSESQRNLSEIENAIEDVSLRENDNEMNKNTEEIDFSPLIPEVKLEIEISSTPDHNDQNSINDGEIDFIPSSSQPNLKAMKGFENCSSCFEIQKKKITTAKAKLLKLRAEIDKILESLDADEDCGNHIK